MFDYGATLQDLITSVRDEIDEPTESAFTDDLIIRSINGRMKEISDYIIREDEDYFEFSVPTISIVANSRSIDLSAYPFYRVISVERIDQGGVPVPLGINSLHNRYRDESYAYANPTYPKVSIRGRYLELTPIPTASATNALKVYGVRRAYKLHYGTAQAGAASTITLATTATKGSVETEDDYYNYCWIKIVSGTGVGQIRCISDYVGSTKVATVDTAWTTTPSATSVYSILPMNANYDRPMVLGAAIDVKRPKNMDTEQMRKDYQESLDLMMATIKSTQFVEPRYINYVDE